MKRFLKKWSIISTYIAFSLLFLTAVPAIVWAAFSFAAMSINPHDWWAIARFLWAQVAIAWFVIVAVAFEDGGFDEMKAQYTRFMEDENEG